MPCNVLNDTEPASRVAVRAVSSDLGNGVLRIECAATTLEEVAAFARLPDASATDSLDAPDLIETAFALAGLVAPAYYVVFSRQIDDHQRESFIWSV